MESPKLTRNTYQTLIIAILVGIIILLRSCETSVPVEPIIKTKIDTLWLEQKRDTIYIPGETEYIPADPEIKYKDVDTTAILKDYFAHRLYQDTINIDTLGFIVIKDDISQNRIVQRHTFLDYKIPTIKETTTITNPPLVKNQVYAGFDIIAGAPTGINYFGPNLLLKTKKDKIYDIGVGINPIGGLNYKFSMGWKIKLRK